MAKRDWVPTDDEVNQAKNVLERAYRSWVNDLAAELLWEAFAEDWDEGELTDTANERCDSGLIYTADQWIALLASRDTQDSWDMMRDGGVTDTEDPVPAWATITYQNDVNRVINDSPLSEGIREHGGRGDDLINWLIEEHGGQEVPIAAGEAVYIIGDIDDVSFGLLRTYNDYHDHEFIGRGLDTSTLKVLLDLVLENGGDFNAPAVKNFIRQARG